VIVLLGYGFVGKAYHKAFSSHHEMSIIDPAFNNARVKDIENISGAIVCVSTPSSEDGSCDMSIIYNVIQDIPKEAPILIKSTISMEGWETLERNFPEHSITFSPEFLRAASADDDLKNLTHTFLAGGNIQYWLDFYTTVYPDISITVCKPKHAIAIKYFRNSFLAAKCSFFNEIYDFCETLGLDYESVRSGVTLDSRIGESHTFVNENDRGWGGACFPKDTAAILQTAKKSGIELPTLEAAVKYNESVRKKV